VNIAAFHLLRSSRRARSMLGSPFSMLQVHEDRIRTRLSNDLKLVLGSRHPQDIHACRIKRVRAIMHACRTRDRSCKETIFRRAHVT
jgi:hypothetical protein